MHRICGFARFHAPERFDFIPARRIDAPRVQATTRVARGPPLMRLVLRLISSAVSIAAACACADDPAIIRRPDRSATCAAVCAIACAAVRVVVRAARGAASGPAACAAARVPVGAVSYADFCAVANFPARALAPPLRRRSLWCVGCRRWSPRRRVRCGWRWKRPQ